MAIKIKKLDKIVSDYVRAKAKFKCERCGTDYTNRDRRAIHASHYMGRTNQATRYDERNIDCLCYGCHAYFEDRKQTEYRDWKILKHGEKEVKEIEALSRTIAKWTPKQKEEIYEQYKQKLAEL